METSWWLNWSWFPDKLIWARLQVADDGTAVVFDCDGRYHRFSTRQDAVYWVNEDEYSTLASLIEGEEVGDDIVPPTAESDQELRRQMYLERSA